MSFPEIHVKATNLELTPELRALLEQKLEPLNKFIPENETDVSCNVELEKTTEQQSGKVFRAEINLHVAGKLYRAEAVEDQIERSIDEMRDDVKRELRRALSKQKSIVRRGSQMIKNMMRFGG